MKAIEGKINFLLETITSFNRNTKVVFVLEEVKVKDFEYIKNNIKGFKFIYSLDIRKRGKYEGLNRGLGLVIAYSSNITLIKYNLLKRTLFPERTLHAIFSCNNYKFGVLGFHALTGVGYKKAKSSQFASIADYIDKNEIDIDFLCFDANEPKTDSYDISNIEFHDQQGDKGYSASLIMGENRVHKLNDAYREYISLNYNSLSKQTKQKIKDKLGTDLLKTSHIITGGGKKRYDYIFCSSRCNVINLEYRLAEAIKAGSDHALVVGEFKFK